MEADKSSETRVSYRNATRRHNLEQLECSPSWKTQIFLLDHPFLNKLIYVLRFN